MAKSKSFASLLEKDLPEIPSYIGDLLPKGGTLLFGGESKIGKSFLALNMAKSLCTGTELYHSGIPCEEAKVLLIEQEIGEEGLQVRGSKIFDGVDKNKFENNFVYETKLTDMSLNRPMGQKIVQDLVAHNEPNVLMLDPIGKMHTCDENDASEIGAMFTFLDSLKKINPKKNMSIVFTHHFKKLDPKWVRGDTAKLDPHNFRGSNRWFSDPDTIVTVLKKKVTTYPHVWWTIRTHWNLRQAEQPDDMMFSVNEFDDFDVRYQYSIDSDEQEVVNNMKPKGKKGKKGIEPHQTVMFRP